MSHASLIFFQAGRGDLDLAADLLADRGMTVERWAREFGDELVVGYSGGPCLRVAFVREAYVREEAVEIAEGTPRAAEMAQCDVRFEVLIDDLDETLDEINTLFKVQITLQETTGGYLFNTWNGELGAPEPAE
jgi:hypothetical protein